MIEEKTCKDCQARFSGDGRRVYCAPCSKARKIVKRPPRRIHCEMCGTDIRARMSQSRFCFPCTRKRAYASQKSYIPNNDNELARKVTRYAVKIGFLYPPTDFKCLDCMRPAECYDHRDYSKPLEVDPVCLRCNSSRHKGIPFKAPKSVTAA